MISRIVSCTIKPEKISEFRTALKRAVLPNLARQPGFVDLVESLDADSGTFVCTTLWNTRQDVEHYDQTLFPELAQKMDTGDQESIRQIIDMEHQAREASLRRDADFSQRTLAED